MSLHHKTKESAIKKYGHLAGAELANALAGDNNNYSPEDQKEIQEAIEAKTSDSKNAPGPNANGAAGQSDKPAATDQAAVQQTHMGSNPLLGPPEDPNRHIRAKLAEFDYTKLRGDKFKQYCLFVQTLPRESKFDFEFYHAQAVKETRYPGVKDSPVDTVGVLLKNTTPINHTRIPVKHALTHNGRVEPFRYSDGTPKDVGFETIGCQLDHAGIHGRYYLLKK